MQYFNWFGIFCSWLFYNFFTSKVVHWSWVVTGIISILQNLQYSLATCIMYGHKPWIPSTQQHAIMAIWTASSVGRWWWHIIVFQCTYIMWVTKVLCISKRINNCWKKVLLNVCKWIVVTVDLENFSVKKLCKAHSSMKLKHTKIFLLWWFYFQIISTCIFLS